MALPIGQGTDLFHFTIRLEHMFNVDLLLHEEDMIKSNDVSSTVSDCSDDISSINSGDRCWLSYSCFGVLIQTPKFQTKSFKNSGRPLASAFPPVTDTFRIQSSDDELSSYFRKNPHFNDSPFLLRVHVCTKGSIVGTATLDVHSLLWARPRNVVSRSSSQGSEQRNGVGGQSRVFKGLFAVSNDAAAAEPSTVLTPADSEAVRAPSIAVTILMELATNKDADEISQISCVSVPKDRRGLHNGSGGPGETGHCSRAPTNT